MQLNVNEMPAVLQLGDLQSWDPGICSGGRGFQGSHQFIHRGNLLAKLVDLSRESINDRGGYDMDILLDG